MIWVSVVPIRERLSLCAIDLISNIERFIGTESKGTEKSPCGVFHGI